MNDDIELDDVQVVQVTGKAHKDKIPKQRASSCDCCTSSLRWTTLIIILAIAVLINILMLVGVWLMFSSLLSLDVSYSNTSVNRLAMMISGDMQKMRQYTKLNAYTSIPGLALRNYSLFKKGQATEEQLKVALESFTDSLYPPNFMTGVPTWNTGSENNYIALLDVDFNTVPGAAFFHPGNSTVLCDVTPSETLPIFKPESFKHMIESDPDAGAWMSIYVPDEGDTRPMMLTFVQVKVWEVEEEVPDDNAYGYLVYGRNFFPRLNNGGSYADDVPTCITLEDGREDAEKWDEEDKKAFDDVKAGTMVSGANAYGGLASFARRLNETITSTKGRICPNVPLFNSTSELMVGYMKLCGVDPNVYGDESCVKIRVDRPTSFLEEGTKPVITLSVVCVVLMVAVCVFFVIVVDVVVLRRIESLSKVIRSQTRGHAKALEADEGSSSTVASVADDKQKGKTGKSSKTKSDKSETSDSSGTNVSGSSKAPRSANDEMGSLKRAMEQNAIGLRKRLEAVNDGIKIEQQKIVHHRQAMQLLNLWCERKDFFPGLQPNAMQLRYEPTRSLDDLLGHSLAVEYLKAHCESDRTVENLWFLLDVEWLEELENAEDVEGNPEQRSQLHDVVVHTAKTIFNRYIASDAPQQINISAEMFKKLREAGEKYSKRMFVEAVSEVKLMLNTDILPRFQKTSSYSAMSETLYRDSAGGGDSSSELSDETVSTAGSVLTDEEGEEGGVGRIFAKTFKGFHAAFDVGHDDNSSSGSSSRHVTADENNAEPITASTTEEKGTLKSSSKDEPSGKDEDEPEKDEPVKDEPVKVEPAKDEPVKVEPAKDEPAKDEPTKSSGSEEKEEKLKQEDDAESSSNSSSSSLSSDSMTESSSYDSSESKSDVSV